MTTAQKIYREISMDDRYESIRWIANVIFTSCGKVATRLKGLKALVDAGHEVGTLSFKMPYEGIRIDGQAVVAMPALDNAAKGKFDGLIPFSSDWYKY